jgi:hypothetical protein
MPGLFNETTFKTRGSVSCKRHVVVELAKGANDKIHDPGSKRLKKFYYKAWIFYFPSQILYRLGGGAPPPQGFGSNRLYSDVSEFRCLEKDVTYMFKFRSICKYIILSRCGCF